MVRTYLTCSFSFRTTIMSKASGDRENSHWCKTTKGNTVKATFTWTIEDYINRPEQKGKGQILKSSIVIAREPNNKTSKWQFGSLNSEGTDIGTRLNTDLELLYDLLLESKSLSSFSRSSTFFMSCFNI